MRLSRILAPISLIPALLATAPTAHASLYSFTSHTFTNCSATGSSGPTQAACRTAYSTTWDESNSNFTVASGIQSWTAPVTGTYTITAAGATGNGGAKALSVGAIIRASMTLTQGATYKIIIGQAGSNGSCNAGGGGGGTFFATSTNSPLVVAGGGGGAISGSVASTSTANGQTTTSGSNSSDGSGSGGTSGNGGGGSTTGWGSGGGGFTGNGGNSANGSSSGGTSFTGGGAGGTSSYSAFGGFGGGGGTHGCTGGGGGGGGYSGGGGSTQTGTSIGGGGGSFVVAGATGIATSNGSYAGSTSGIANLAQYNGTYGSSTMSHGYLTIALELEPVTVNVGPTSGGFNRTFRTPIELTATLSAAGARVTFYQQGKKIARCIMILTTTTTATCSWSPSMRGSITVTAQVSPTNGARGLPSNGAVFFIANRSGAR